MYGGFILPYATPTEMPYPLFIGAVTENETYRYSRGNYEMGSFYDPSSDTAFMRNFDGAWYETLNYIGSSSKSRSGTTTIWPYRSNVTETLIRNRDTSYTLSEVQIITQNNQGNVFGEFEGVG